MTNEELKDALINRYPIIYRNPYGEETEYKFVTAIIYREVNRRVKVEAEIMHGRGYVLTCDPATIRRKGADDL